MKEKFYDAYHDIKSNVVRAREAYSNCVEAELICDAALALLDAPMLVISGELVFAGTADTDHDRDVTTNDGLRTCDDVRSLLEIANGLYIAQNQSREQHQACVNQTRSDLMRG